MRDNRGELALSEAGGNPVGDTTFQFCDLKAQRKNGKIPNGLENLESCLLL